MTSKEQGALVGAVVGAPFALVGLNGVAYSTAKLTGGAVVVASRTATEEQRDIEARLGAWRLAMQGAAIDLSTRTEPVAGYIAARLPCPLLDIGTGLCRIYDHRPLSCRGELVVDEGHGGARCADPTARPLHVPVTSALYPAFRELMRNPRIAAPKLLWVPILLPELLRLAWPLVRGTTSWSGFMREIRAWNRRAPPVRPDPTGTGVEAMLSGPSPDG